MIEFTLLDGQRVTVDHKVYLEIMKLREQVAKLKGQPYPPMEDDR